MSEGGSNVSLEKVRSVRSSVEKARSGVLARLRSSDLKALNRDIPEGMSLRAIDLMTNASLDDLAKHLVRTGRMGIEDVLEIVDSQGQIVGSKVLPHAEGKYLEELAIEEAARTEKSYSWTRLSSPDLLSELMSLESDSDTLLTSTYLSGTPKDDLYNENEEEETEEEEELDEDSNSREIDGDGEGEGPLKYPQSVESLYQLIEPERENEFNTQIEQLNSQMADIQNEICTGHKKRQLAKVRYFILDKETVQESITELGVLYFPGNFMEPIIGRRICDKDIPFILDSIQEVPNFKGFNFAYNNITDEGLNLLAQFFQENTAVVHLNVAHNDFTAKGLHALVMCLMNRSSLHSLKISGVKVGDEGISSITCLFMCGKGPLDLDVSETDMTMPGFQALCSAVQAVDEDDDYPKYLTKHKLPFTLETLAQLKVENNEQMKGMVYTRLRNSQFELVKPSESSEHIQNDEMERMSIEHTKTKGAQRNTGFLNDEVTHVLEDLFITSAANAKDATKAVDLSKQLFAASQVADKAKTLPDVDEFIQEHRMKRHTGCASAQQHPNSRPVIICPSLYSLEIDEFVQDEGTSGGKKPGGSKKVNPSYMDTLIESALDEALELNKEVADNLTAQKGSINFVRETFNEAAAVAGTTDFDGDIDVSQLLFITILDTAKKYLETEKDGDDFSDRQLQLIWEYAFETVVKILRPVVPPHCMIAPVADVNAIKTFFAEFVKVACLKPRDFGENPILESLFFEAVCNPCTKKARDKETDNTLPTTPLPRECVQNVILRFLEETILQAAEIIGTGDPYNLRGTAGLDRKVLFSNNGWPSLEEITDELVEPLVEDFLKAGALLAFDARKCQDETKARIEDGIEPAKQFLEGTFNELSNFLYQLNEENTKLAETMTQPPQRFAFATKPVRLVLNRPFFNGYEAIMASKLAAYLGNNQSLQCLHIRKWGLGEDGMINLMDGIMTNMFLVTLDLGCNGIGAEGLRALGEYLRKNHSLKHLLLNHNRLRNPGIQALTDSISESSLVSINVAFNDITDLGLDPFLEAIRKSKIRSLYVLGNCFSQTSWILLNELFESKILYKPECDVELQEVDGLGLIARNSQARDMNEWYEVPAKIDLGLVCPPHYLEVYRPPKTTIFGATDVDI
ncbi:Leucine-rich repeat-containing protein 34 [Orchesella cincta]|uniref:Leucine-rich repeat-containing protein 34 n=1 Tax=Orchesella cincta TaxID=48709 RepID=A0A1D2NAY1_ORCCI|nr:Leucine-rich repeat-containing protein 34 [Orchesella cincta]